MAIATTPPPTTTATTLASDVLNRLVEYNDGSSLTVTYTHASLNRRITQTQPAEDPRDFYYSANWQIVEERLGATTDAQYVWSPVYVDAMVFRDKDTNVGNIRSFAMQDANFNVTRPNAARIPRTDLTAACVQGMLPGHKPQSVAFSSYLNY